MNFGGLGTRLGTLGADLSTGGGSQPGFPVTQTVAFGNRTFAGHGGHSLGYAGAGTLSISAGNEAGYWAISGNKLVIAGAYGAAPPALGTGNGAYTLTIGDGTVSSVVTVDVEANVYDWSTQADWNQIAVLSAATLSGRTIKARPGIAGVIASGVDGTAARFRRADFGGLVVTSRDMTSKPVFDRFQFNGTKNLTLKGVAFEPTTAQKITVIGSATWPIDGVVIRDCFITGLPFDIDVFDWAGTTPPNPDMIVFSGLPAYFANCQIINNEIKWAKNGINVYQGGGSAPLIVSGNLVSMIAGGDGIKVSYGGTANENIVEDNVVFDFLSRGTDFGNPHQDGIQFPGSGAATTDFTVKVNRNIIWNGQRGAPQGIFADDHGTGGNYHNVGEAKGNLIMLNTTHGLSILRARSFVAEGNTVVSDVTSGASAGGIKIGAGSVSAYTAGTHVLTRNIADSLTIGGTPTLTDNILLGAGGATIPYTSVFDGDGSGLWKPSTRALALAMFSRKAGGPADLPSGFDAGAVGSGYVNWPTTSPGNDGSFN